jgi:hypothetical protein
MNYPLLKKFKKNKDRDKYFKNKKEKLKKK